MNTYLADIKKKIEESELIVVGLGEEWNISLTTRNDERYQRIINDLKDAQEYRWILPYVYRIYTDEQLNQAYRNLFSMLEGKNYYVVATTVNRSFMPYVKEGRAVMPCGSDFQLKDNTLTVCEEVKKTQRAVEDFIVSLDAYVKGEILLTDIAFMHNEEGEIIPFNSVYSSNYNEEGYLADWNKYMKWLQGTMNRKTCLLELGAGLQFPSVFRFPFEKMAYFNQKAFCFRVHNSLYQVTEEMADRSKSIPMHSVDLFADFSM